MTLPDSPAGWMALQEKAKRAKNAEELSAIIEEMNQLLSECEKAAGNGHDMGQMPSPSRNFRKEPDKKKDR